MAGLGAKEIMRNVTALEQLIEEINFQRAKEMRQCLMSKDSSAGIVYIWHSIQCCIYTGLIGGRKHVLLVKFLFSKLKLNIMRF